MADFLDFLPLTRETIDTIRTRLDLDANAGVEPEDTGYLDLTEGGFYFDLTQPPALEAERLWDFLSTEVVAAMFVQSAWGEYLDMHGEMLGVDRKDEVKATGAVTFLGTDGAFIPTGTQVARAATDPDADPITFVTIESGIVGAPFDPDADPVVYSTPGEITLAVEAQEAGPQGNVGSEAVQFLLSAIENITQVTNRQNISGGSDVESDEAYQARLLLEWRRPGAAGNAADYERWALAYPGVGHVSVEPVWNGPNSVRVVITDAERNPSSGAVIAGLQTLLDPAPVGSGQGLAPIGAEVTVATVSNFYVPVSATVFFEPGYSLDGAAGTIALREVIETTITDYINSLGPGEDVVLAKVESLFFRIAGIYDVTDAKLNNVAANFVISATQVAVAGTVSLTAAP